MRDEKIEYVILYSGLISTEKASTGLCQGVQSSGRHCGRGHRVRSRKIDPISIAASLKMKISNATAAAHGANKWQFSCILRRSWPDTRGSCRSKGSVVRWFGTDSTAMNNVISSNNKQQNLLWHELHLIYRDFGVVFHPLYLKCSLGVLEGEGDRTAGRVPDPTYQYDMICSGWRVTLMNARSSDLKETTYEVAQRTYGFSGLCSSMHLG